MSVRSVLEDVLLTTLWAGEKLSRPTLNNLLEPFEAWERRYGLHRQIVRMEKRNLVQREQRGEQLVYQLTGLGRLKVLGGKDPQARWNRSWDGRWRQVLFDLPVAHKRARLRLWRWLRTNGLGYLQQSLWITPDPVPDVSRALDGFRDDVESFILMEATCCPGYTNAAVVNGAWDFVQINKRYESVLAAVSLSAREMDRLKASPERLGRWLLSVRMAWEHALAMDPLLPRELWPKGYLGGDAWEARRRSCRALAERTC